MKKLIMILLAATFVSVAAFADHPKGMGVGLVAGGNFGSGGAATDIGLSLKLPSMPIFWAVRRTRRLCQPRLRQQRCQRIPRCQAPHRPVLAHHEGVRALARNRAIARAEPSSGVQLPRLVHPRRARAQDLAEVDDRKFRTEAERPPFF